MALAGMVGVRVLKNEICGANELPEGAADGLKVGDAEENVGDMVGDMVGLPVVSIDIKG